MLRMNVRMWAAALALTLSAAAMDAADWVNLDPGGPLTAFAVDPRDPGVLYAATGGPPGVGPDSPPGFRSRSPRNSLPTLRISSTASQIMRSRSPWRT
jgi:hypothetical protein